MKKVFLDIETTGINFNSEDISKGNRIIEIACILENQGILERKEWLINPEKEITEESYRINRISNDDVKNCRTFSQIVDEFLKLINGCKIIAHNATFDVNFINNEIKFTLYKEHSIDFKNVIDTYQLAKDITNIGTNLSLDSLARFYKISLNDTSKRHRAMFDAELLRNVYNKMMGSFQKTFNLNSFDKKKEQLKKEFSLLLIKPSLQEEEQNKLFFEKILNKNLLN